MSFQPIEPSVRVEPLEIGPETFLVRQVQEALGAPLCVYLNSMVIRGDEPVIVDTGTRANRKQWLDDVFSIVEPADVRWVFLSHDDVDHTGNLAEVMEECRNATLVASWALVERASNAFEFPLERCRWVNDGESFVAGDRTLVAARPPLYDSPTTRGLYDATTGVYWAVDSFATPMPGAPVEQLADVDRAFWQSGMTMFLHHALSPWLSIVDHDKFAATVDATRALGMTTIASAHAPVISGDLVDAVFAVTRSLPAVEPPELPGQEVLDAVLGAIAA